MQRFTIDYLTRNTASSSAASLDAEINVTNHDGLLTSSGSNYLHTSLHLDDVYSVISKDTEVTSSPLVIDTTYHYQEREPVQLASQTEFVSGSDSHVTQLTSPSETDYQYSLERATPSPNKDSGIESDNSPVSNSSTSSEDVSESIRHLEKKANKISKKSTSTDKPGHSYITLIALAILDSRDRKLTLSDIYRHIMENHEYYNNEEKAWRNSIRYNLSINECFIKAGKDESAGKGNLWAIHPACYDDFKKGDFRRRQARRRAKRTLKGLGPADTTQMDNPSVRSSSMYQTMTPSYVNYHPYATSGSTQRHHQMSDYAHAYNGQVPVPASRYNTYAQYPSSQYTPMSQPTYNPSTYDYLQQYARFYQGCQESSNITRETREKDEQVVDEAKYYAYPLQSYLAAQQDAVPTNNTIEIL